MEPTQRNKAMSLVGSLAAVVLTFSMVLVFGDRIASKPSQAGFWLIFALGLSVGAAATSVAIYFWKKE